MTAEERFTAALRSVMAALDELAAPSMIIGNVAVIAAGVPRQTIDIDATILGRAAALGGTPGLDSYRGILGMHAVPGTASVRS